MGLDGYRDRFGRVVVRRKLKLEAVLGHAVELNYYLPALAAVRKFLRCPREADHPARNLLHGQTGVPWRNHLQKVRNAIVLRLRPPAHDSEGEDQAVSVRHLQHQGLVHPRHSPIDDLDVELEVRRIVRYQIGAAVPLGVVRVGGSDALLLDHQRDGGFRLVAPEKKEECQNKKGTHCIPSIPIKTSPPWQVEGKIGNKLIRILPPTFYICLILDKF